MKKARANTTNDYWDKKLIEAEEEFAALAPVPLDVPLGCFLRFSPSILMRGLT